MLHSVMLMGIFLFLLLFFPPSLSGTPVISLLSFLVNYSRWQCISQKAKKSCHPQNYRVRVSPLLSDSAVSLCRLFLGKHVEMHNLFELILEIEDRATGTEDAGCCCIWSLHSEVSVCSNCTGVRTSRRGKVNF